MIITVNTDLPLKREELAALELCMIDGQYAFYWSMLLYAQMLERRRFLNRVSSHGEEEDRTVFSITPEGKAFFEFIKEV